MPLTNPATLVTRLTADFADEEYRDAYVEANIAAGVAHQVRINREARGWTQADLAQRLGSKQSLVSRLEDPDYGRLSIKTLLSLARTFQCALEVRFVSFSRFLEDHADLSPTALVAKPYEADLNEIKKLANTRISSSAAGLVNLPFSYPASRPSLVKMGMSSPAPHIKKMGFTSTVSSSVASVLFRFQDDTRQGDRFYGQRSHNR
jgi:transcriptional regulator with XRE-family HTH domain